MMTSRQMVIYMYVRIRVRGGGEAPLNDEYSLANKYFGFSLSILVLGGIMTKISEINIIGQS